MQTVFALWSCLARLILVGPQKKKDRAVMQEIYIWDQEEILEKSTAIVVYLDQARENRGRFKTSAK